MCAAKHNQIPPKRLSGNHLSGASKLKREPNRRSGCHSRWMKPVPVKTGSGNPVFTGLSGLPPSREWQSSWPCISLF